jgi:hypothetical protein
MCSIRKAVPFPQKFDTLFYSLMSPKKCLGGLMQSVGYSLAY